MSHVFEHFTDFRGALSTTQRVLNPGGVLAIQTPNRRSLVTWRNGVDYRPVEHPFYWTYRALARELRRARLQPLLPPPVRPPEGFRGLFKEAAILVERLTAPRMNFGIKSTLELHGLKWH